MDVFRTPDERFEGLPGYGFAPNYAEIGGLRLHYVDEGEGPPVVLSHALGLVAAGWPLLYSGCLEPALAQVVASRPLPAKARSSTNGRGIPCISM